ncbi:unnamed protein product [Caenorhabditis nigoni]|uniref:Uncharacterized protein n=1 Tax=Caenorhabditis nigoni TaxID=1611254 RepID=A0A2G5VK88_9PELO|nr:hypothetical protein B9Z55_002383 [Caenorhabditis nigoni]
MRTLAVFVVLLLVAATSAAEGTPSVTPPRPTEKPTTGKHMEEGPRRNGTDMDDRQDMPEGGHDDRREMESEIPPGKEGGNAEAAGNPEGNPSEEATSVTSGGIVFGGVFATITALSYLF